MPSSGAQGTKLNRHRVCLPWLAERSVTGTVGAHPHLKAASLADLQTDTGLIILRSVDRGCCVFHFRAGQSGDAVTLVTLVLGFWPT